MNLEIRSDAGFVIFRVKAIPGAKKPGISGIHDGALKVKVASPPERGRANQEITEILAEAAGIKQKDIEIIKGNQSKDKTLRVKGAVITQITKLAEE